MRNSSSTSLGQWMNLGWVWPQLSSLLHAHLQLTLWHRPFWKSWQNSILSCSRAVSRTTSVLQHVHQDHQHDHQYVHQHDQQDHQQQQVHLEQHEDEETCSLAVLGWSTIRSPAGCRNLHLARGG